MFVFVSTLRGRNFQRFYNAIHGVWIYIVILRQKICFNRYIPDLNKVGELLAYIIEVIFFNLKG